MATKARYAVKQTGVVCSLVSKYTTHTEASQTPPQVGSLANSISHNSNYIPVHHFQSLVKGDMGGTRPNKKVLGSIPGQDISVWSLHVLPMFMRVFSRYSGFLPQSKNM